MGQACGFGQAILSYAGEGHFYGVFERAFVAHGDEDGFDIAACSEHGSDSLVSRISSLVFRLGLDGSFAHQ